MYTHHIPKSVLALEKGLALVEMEFIPDGLCSASPTYILLGICPTSIKS
jgi:hypothetical protein